MTVSAAHHAATTNPSFVPARRDVSGDLRAIPGILRSEWIKLLSLRATLWLLMFNVVAGLAVSWAVATWDTGEVLYVNEVTFYWTVVTAILASVMGVMLFSADAESGTLPVMLTAQPARWPIVCGKTVMAVMVGGVLGASGLAAGFAGAVMAGLDMGSGRLLAASIPWALGYTMLAAVLGLGVGLVVRSGAVAITVVLVWGLVIENLLTLFLPITVSRFLPFLAGDRLLAIDTTVLNPEAAAVALTRIEGGLVLGAYSLLALLAGMVVLSHRDVT